MEVEEVARHLLLGALHPAAGADHELYVRSDDVLQGVAGQGRGPEEPDPTLPTGNQILEKRRSETLPSESRPTHRHGAAAAGHPPGAVSLSGSGLLER